MAEGCYVLLCHVHVVKNFVWLRWQKKTLHCYSDITLMGRTRKIIATRFSSLPIQRVLRYHVAAYTSTKNVAQQLKTAKRPAAFEEQHRAELTAYRAAAAYFKANDLTKLPSPKKLEAEYAQLASEKAKFYEQYKEAKEELFKLKTAKQNVASFFREEEPA